MKFSTVALLSSVAVASVAAVERVDFAMPLVTKEINGVEYEIALNDQSYCEIEYEAMPFSVDCHLGLDISNESGVLASAGATAGAKVILEDNDLKLNVEYGAEIPLIKLDGTLEVRSFPEGGGNVIIDLPDVTKVCASQILPVLPGSEADILEFITKNSGSDVCVGLQEIKKDKTDGVSFKVIASVDFLNEDLVQSALLTKEQFVNLRTALNLPEIDLEIDVGAKLAQHLKTHAVSERRLRRLADGEGSTGARYMGDDGTFKMGSMAKEESNGMLFVGAAAGVAGVALVAVGGFIFHKKRLTHV